MSTSIIGADAAKLAGLQIDLLQKMRQDQISIEHLEWFTKLNKSQRDILCGADLSALKPTAQPEPTEKFALLVDLGFITVPGDYDHANRLAAFGKQNRKRFYYYNDDIIDENFPNPSRILKPGDKLGVRVFKQIIGGTTTSKERMEFLATQKAIYTGAQGASIVFEQKRDQLPKGKWYASFDEKDRLWKDAVGDHRVPHVRRLSGGAFWFDLGYFEYAWNDDDCLLCFCDLPSVA